MWASAFVVKIQHDTTSFRYDVYNTYTHVYIYILYNIYIYIYIYNMI